MSNIPEEVILRYAYKNELSTGESRALFDELEAFLDAASNSPLSPSEEVDSAWHEFILHTKMYWQFCANRYGRVIHHVPTSPTVQSQDDDDEQDNDDGEDDDREIKRICGSGVVSELEKATALSLTNESCSSDCHNCSSCHSKIQSDTGSNLKKIWNGAPL